MLDNLKLKSRILLGYAVPIPLSIFIAYLVYVNTQIVGRLTQSTHALRDGIEITDAMESNAAVVERVTRGYIIVNKQSYIERFQEATKSLDEESAKAKILINKSEFQAYFSDDIKNIFEELFKSCEQIKTLNEKFIFLVKDGKQNEAVKLFAEEETVNLSRKIHELNKNYNEKSRQILSQQESQMVASLNFLNGVAILGSVLSMLVAIGFGLWLSSKISQQIMSAVSAIATSSTEIATTVEQQERTASAQAASVNQTTITMDELGASSRQAAEQAEMAAASARQLLSIAESSEQGAVQVLGLAEGGTKIVEQTVQGMSALNDKVAEITEQIVRLREQASQIGSITTLVTDIASQTNMLSLNAAVEAARAGENGKGFAVVASEIRKLASQSKKSAEKINYLISDIQNTINMTVVVTEQGKKNTSETIKLCQLTSDSFVSVSQAINDVILRNQEISLVSINDMVIFSQQISLNAKQQAVAVQQVVAAMNSINQGATQNACGISQTKVSTQQLNDAAFSLKTVV